MSKKELTRYGKLVGGALYFHRRALVLQARKARLATVCAAEVVGKGVWGIINVIKIQGNPPTRVTLLAYENFESSSFPALLESWTVDLADGKTRHRSFRASANPPILHRKELLLPPDDPARQNYAHVTEQLEKRGIFSRGRQIGFKKQWERALAQAGVQVHGHEVSDVGPEGEWDGDQDER